MAFCYYRLKLNIKFEQQGEKILVLNNDKTVMYFDTNGIWINGYNGLKCQNSIYKLYIDMSNNKYHGDVIFEFDKLYQEELGFVDVLLELKLKQTRGIYGNIEETDNS